MDGKYVQQFKKGSLEMILLCLIAQKETYGYEILTQLNQRGGGVLGYAREVSAYTKGHGQLSCIPAGYAPCHNSEEIIAAAGYDADSDLENTADSVFCSHGAGVVVRWDKVPSRMHIPSVLARGERIARAAQEEAAAPPPGSWESRAAAYRSTVAQDKELIAIFERTYGPIKRDPLAAFRPTQKRERPDFNAEQWEIQPEYLLVDGYNIIFAWDELNALSKESLEAARHRLMDILCNYQGFKKCTLILVFDAYKIEGHAEEVITYHNIHVVYTKEAETADQYIEKTVHKIGRENQVTVATSDGLEQIIIMGQGAHRMSARGLRDEIKATENQIRQQWHEKRQSSKNYLIDNISDEMAQYMKEKRLGKQ